MADFNDIFAKQSVYSCTANEIILLIGTALLLLILLAEFFDWGQITQSCRPSTEPEPPFTMTDNFDYGYEDHNGPSVWKCQFPAALGIRQSPINIASKNALVCPASLLSWSSEYTVAPDRIRILNDGHCVNLQARYTGRRPAITGGPLTANYDLYSIRFRWGPTDDEGSEHTIDYRRFAMELQAVHVKRGCNCAEEALVIENNAIIVISYVFQTTTIDNPYLEPVLNRLERIQYPGYATLISPFPICWLMPVFVSDYYTYQGSLTYPPCTEGIQWIVQPEPLAVSPRQIRKFRKLITKRDGRMVSNTRPIQCLNNREIFYYTASDDCKCK